MEHCRKRFKTIAFKYLLEKQVQKCFSYLLDSRLVSTALKPYRCCILEGRWQRFESLAGAAEAKQQAGACTWPLWRTSGASERQLLYLEKPGKLRALEATRENLAMFWRELEAGLSFWLVKCRCSGMRSICRSTEKTCLDDKVDETVLKSAGLQWVRNKAKGVLVKGNERQYEKLRLCLCPNILNLETACILPANTR